MDLYLRRVNEIPESYRVILKIDETEFQIGSIGVQTFTSSDTSWTWGIDTVIPLRAMQSEGRGESRRDCEKKFRAAWEKHCAKDGWLEEFLAMKRKRSLQRE